MKSIFKKTLCSIMLFCLLFLCVGVVTKVSAADKGVEKTIAINATGTFTPSLPSSKNNLNTVATIHKVNGFSFYEKGVYNASSYLMFTENKGFIYNSDSLGTIKSVSITYSGGTSISAKVGVTFGNEILSTKDDTANKIIAGKNKTDMFTNNQNGYGFFQISSSKKNAQIVKIVITYEDSVTEGFNVTFNSNGGSGVKSQTVKKDDKVAKPADPELEGNLFLGWFEEGQDTEFDFNTPITTDITLVARWKPISWYSFLTLPTSASLNISYDKTTVSTSVNYYTKVTEGLEDYSGTYLIVYEDTDDLKVFNGLDQVNGYVSARKNENNVLVETEELSACQVIVAAMEGGYSIQISSGDNNSKYMSSASKNGITFSDSKVLNSIEIANEIAIITSNSKTIKFNSNIDQMRFRYYGSGQKDVVLYKLSETPMTVEKEAFTFGNASLRFGLVQIPASDYENMVAEGATFGIALTKGETIDIATATKFDCTPVRVNAKGVEDANGEDYQFAVVINDITNEDFTSVVSAVAYVKIGDDYHAVNESKTFSIKTLAAHYVSLYEASPKEYSELEQHINALKALAK